MLRWILILAIVVVPIVICFNCVVPHEGHGSGVFTALYMHLIPADLVSGAHDALAPHHPLVSFGVPLPHLFDMDHAKDGVQLVVTNLQLFQLAAILIILVGFSGVASHLKNGGSDWLTRLLAGFASWVREEMVYATMGRERGQKFLPFFLALFFFIMFMNVLGLIPGAATATASVWVTAALASITLFSMLVCGMIVQGPIAFWKNLVPHVPVFLWPLMFFVEFVGLFVKPFALTIRLFANMNGGHMVVLSFLGLMLYFGQTRGQAVGWATMPVALIFAVFMMVIESFVALLQAFIFTQLSILFVQTSVHPEH